MNKVVFIVAGQWSRAGGAEIVTQDVARTFANLGWSVTVVDMQGTGRSELRPDRIFLKRFGLPNNRAFRSLWHRGLNVRSAARFLKRDPRARNGLLIYAHIRTLPLDTCLPKDILPTRWAWTYGTDVWGEQAVENKPLLDRLDHIIAISAYTAGHMRKANVVPPISVIPCSVDADYFTPTPTPDRIRRDEILICSRLHGDIRNKGHDTLLEALPIAEAMLGRSLSLRIIGDGAGKEVLRAKANSMQLADRVFFAGGVSDEALLEGYRHCGVFAMPSRSEYRHKTKDWTGEGLGLVYVEAALCGRPVVVSADGGAPETVQDGVTGLIANPRDAHAFAAAIASILADPTRADSMGQAGRAFAAERFSRRHLEDRISQLAATPLS